MPRKNLLYCFILLSCLNLSAFSAFSQDSTIGRVSIASPNAASLGKYGDIPVSYHTGIPNIDIPIYTIKSGSLSLPISLSYHASGLKVQEQASWVGAGWTLNAGGVITRTVRGAPDDRGFYSAHTVDGYFSQYGYNNYLFTSGHASCGGTGPPCAIGTSVPADDISIAGGVKDGEPDLYFFSFDGYTGKFYFNDDRTPVLVPEADFKIIPIYPYDDVQIAPIGIEGFIVVTPDGNKYYFGKNQSGDGNPDAIEETTDLTFTQPSNSGQGAVSSWFLNKIVSPDGTDSIKLVYQPDSLSYYALSMFPVYPISTTQGAGFPSANHEYDLLKNFVKGVRLAKITFANGGEVDFTPGVVRQDLGDYSSMIIGDVANTTSTALGAIQIRDNNGFCKKDTFYFSYFHDTDNSLNGFFHNTPPISSITSDSYRLRLDSVQELTCDAAIKIPPYKFSYFSGTVPRKLSFGIDHWGFYNGVTSNQTLIPTYYITSGNIVNNYPGADRDPHWPAMEAGTLEQINYPTGGYTRFDFEPNDTYCHYDTYTTASYGFSAGYDGSSQSTSYFTTSASSGTYQLIFTNNLSSGTASVDFQSLGSFNLQAGVPDTTYINLTPSHTYTIVTSISNPLTGQGVSGTFTQFIPTTVGGNVMVGGLRIKTITNNDGISSTNIVTSYAYNYGGTQSSGILYSRPVYVQELRNDVYKLVGPYSSGNTLCSVNGCITCDPGYAGYYKSPSSIRPMATTQGSHIGYNEVRVSQTNNGYSVYRYYGSDIWDYDVDDVAVRDLNNTTCDLSAPNYPAAPLPFEYMRGELKYEGHFDNNGHILKDAWYFPEYVQDSTFTPALIARIVTTGSTGFQWFTPYQLHSARKAEDSVVSTTYDPANNTSLTTTKITYYNSPFHHQPTDQVTYTSTGDRLDTKLKYADDFRIYDCDTISSGWDDYYADYLADSLTCYSLIATCTDTDGWSCKWLAYQQYRFNQTQARQSYVSLRRTNFTDSANLFDTHHLDAKNNADSELKPVLELQDEYRNPVIEHSQWKNNNLLGAGFTRYDYESNPSGIVYPNKTQLINLSEPSTSFTDAAVSGNTIAKDSRYLDESTYSFSAGHPVQVMAHDSINISYIWDYSNTSPIAKVTNASTDQIAYTSFEADGGGNWTIGSTTRITTGGITGDNCYQLSNGSISKSGLNTGTKYVLSYWTKNGSSFTITGAQGAPLKGKTVNGWTYYEHTITGMSQVTIPQVSGLIDELRLYPAGSLMTTYTYEPINGMTSQCNADNLISYYEYDKLGRLEYIKDQDGNVVKTIDYHYKGQGQAQ